MPFCRARLSAKRFTAGVGGYAAAPLPAAAPSKDGPPAAAPSFSLPMMQLGRCLPLVLDTYSKRALESLSGVDDCLGNLTPEDALLRRMAHLEFAGIDFRGGDNLKICDGHEVSDF